MNKNSIDEESTELDDIIAEYLVAEESGETVSRSALLKEHPELTKQLNEFFADRDRFKRLASPLSPEASRRNDLPTRVRYFGDYELLEEVAQGGMGVVYKARQTKLNRIVAVKMVLAGHLAGEDDIKRFADEAETAANLKHKGIVPIHEVGQQNGQHYFSMDFIEGKNLAELIRTAPPSPQEAARIVKEIADAVAYAHAQGTVHRDIKPSNILIDEAGQTLITDFGLAMRVEGDHDLTRTGQVLGTPAYMSPEQASGKRDRMGPSSDIYSLGAILYELLTGRPPLRGETAIETIQQVLDCEPIPPHRLNGKTPRDLETICLTCLKKETHNRYRTAELLSDDLGRFLADEPIMARRVGSVERKWRWCKRNPAVASLTVAVAVLLVCGTAISTYFAIEANSRAMSEARLKQSAVESQENETAARRVAEERGEQLEQALRDLDESLQRIGRLNRVLRADPTDVASLTKRGHGYAQLGMWEEAGLDYVRAVELKPDDSNGWVQAGAIMLETGDVEGYRRLCEDMLEHFGNTSNFAHAARTAHICCLTPNSEVILTRAAQIAEEASTIAPTSKFPQLVKGLSMFRQGMPNAAIESCREFLRRLDNSEWVRAAEAHLIIAMAAHQLTQGELAEREFRTAVGLLDAQQSKFTNEGYQQWKQWLVCQPLRREAEALFSGDNSGENSTDSNNDVSD